jgi:hypothetical protein
LHDLFYGKWLKSAKSVLFVSSCRFFEQNDICLVFIDKKGNIWSISVLFGHFVMPIMQKDTKKKIKGRFIK